MRVETIEFFDKRFHAVSFNSIFRLKSRLAPKSALLRQAW